MKVFNRVALYGLFFLFFAGAYTAFQFYAPVTLGGGSQVVDVPSGVSSRQIGRILEDRGIIRSARFFYYYVKITGAGPKLRAGAFLVYPSMSLAQVVVMLQEENGTANLVRVTIPEGYNAWDIGDLLESKGLVVSREFSQYVHDYAKDELKGEFMFLADIPVTTIEGYLFPETYYFSPHSSTKVIVRTMLKQFRDVVIPIWEAAPAPAGSPKARFNLHQILTVASLIEKESRVVSEMPRISSVFYNRLQKRMPLASDPTIVYALGRSYKRRVLYKDLEIDSPYNTYRRSGFPPSPIASFGKAAVEASLTPEVTPYFFFVANNDGTHTFTRTYREHLNVQRNR